MQQNKTHVFKREEDENPAIDSMATLNTDPLVHDLRSMVLDSVQILVSNTRF